MLHSIADRGELSVALVEALASVVVRSYETAEVISSKDPRGNMSENLVRERLDLFSSFFFFFLTFFQLVNI